MSKSNKVTADSDGAMIEIQSEYYREIEKIVAHSQQFSSASDYVNFVLKEFLYGGDAARSEPDQAALKRRLKDLGYL